MHNPQDSLNATLELSQSFAAAAAAQEQKSSIDVLSVPISLMTPNMTENSEFPPSPFSQSIMQGEKEISKEQFLPGSPDNRLPTVAGSNRTATNTELPSTNGSLPETKTKGTVRIILLIFFTTFGKLLVWWQQKQKCEPLILKMYT